MLNLLLEGRRNRRGLGKAAAVLVVALLVAAGWAACMAVSIPASFPPADGTKTAASGTSSTAGDVGSALVPLTDLGNRTYQGYVGGLYPGGRNSMPSGHLTDGLIIAKNVVPLDGHGNSSSTGKIVLMTVGMSNTAMISQSFIELANKSGILNPRLVLVNGAEGGMTASILVTNSSTYWDQWVGQHLASSNVTALQVQAVWYYEADAQPTGSVIACAQKLQAETVTIMGILHSRYPNLKQVYVSSREFAGYATTALNPEPYSYASGYSMKWVIEAQLNGSAQLNYDPALGPVKSPWIAWGPYTWADGLKPRDDGLTYSSSDFGSDGTHPSTQGAQKIASQLLTFFQSSPTAKSWFVSSQQ
jgi:hypothetical protein